MATTFTGIFVSAEGTLLLAHAGDSRAYLLRDGAFERRTRDDSYVQALVDRGLLDEDAAASHPHRNLITASFGGAEGDHPRVAEFRSEPGDRWMLCSDGATDYVPEPLLHEVLDSVDRPADAAASAVELALDADTRDNVTVVVCDVVAGDPHADPPTFFGSAAARFREELESA